MVFTKDVDRRTAREPELRDLTDRIGSAASAEVRTALEADYATRWNELRAQTVKAVAEEFDAVHTIQRAVDVGSVDEIVTARDLRPRIVGALEEWFGRNAPDGSSAADSSPFAEVPERDVDDESLQQWLHMMKVAGRWRERRFAAPSPQPWFSVSPAPGGGLHPQWRRTASGHGRMSMADRLRLRALRDPSSNETNVTNTTNERKRHAPAGE